MAWVGDTIWGESGRKPVADLTQILSHPTSFELTFKVILNLFSFHFISVADRIQPYDPPTIYGCYERVENAKNRDPKD